jgi:acetolactate synthase-1/2/3 large subunit
VDIPKDIQNSIIENYDFKNIKLSVHERHLKPAPVSGDMEKFSRALNKAEKPLLYVGGGATISGAHKEILEIAQKASIPVVMTLNGLSAFPGNHELSLGMLGMHGTRFANSAVLETDLIVSLGARFDDRVTSKLDEFAPRAKKAHFDIDPAEINKVVRVDYQITGDLKSALKELSPLVKANKREAWVGEIKAWKKNYPLKFTDNSNTIKPQHIIRRLYEITKGNAIIASDVGQHQMWTAQYYLFDKPRSWIASGGLGTMGFGFPAAIGAKVACPEQLVIAVSGDGSFQMNIQELATLSMYDISVKIILLENRFLGMVRQWQEMFYEERYSQTNFHFNPDFVKIADAYGIQAKRIDKKSEVEDGLKFLLKDDKSALLVVRIPEEEKVFPFIPAGGSYRDMIDFPDEA